MDNNQLDTTTTENEVKQIKKQKIVTVKKLTKENWHGKTGKEDFSRPRTITALVDGSTGKYKTGLTDEEAIEYGKLLGVSLSNIFNINKPHEFFDSPAGKVRLESATTTLNLNNPRDYVKYCILKESPLVANSQEELDSGFFPEALYIMFNEEGEEKIKLSRIEKRRLATKELFSLDSATKRQIVRILSEKSTRGKSEKFVEIEIDSIIENKTEEFLALISSKDKSTIFLKALVLEALDRNILIKEEGKIKYMGEAIGLDTDDCVSFLGNNDNQLIKMKILEKVQN